MTLEEIKSEFDRLALRKQNVKPTIVAYGLMNAGKSYLMNMLTKHVEDEFFKTNDIRETVVSAAYETAHCIYVDTPGLDATDEDDAEAQHGAREGDIVLFVHQPQGELDATELTFLQALRTSLAAHAATNIALVLSKMEKEAPEKIALIEQRIAQQCREALGFAPRQFCVSGKRYRDGIQKQKAALTANSGIDALAAHLQQLATDVQLVRARKQAVRIEALLAEVATARRAAVERQSSLRTKVRARFSVFNDQIAQLNRFLSDSALAYKKI